MTIALGTDIFATGPATGMTWGMNGREFVHLVDAGLTPMEAIEAGTANGPPTLGPQAPKSGQLAEGYDADIIAVCSEPARRHVSVLADPANVTHVWKAGELVKSPGYRRSSPDRPVISTRGDPWSSLEGRIAVVTGGGTGMGRELVEPARRRRL